MGEKQTQSHVALRSGQCCMISVGAGAGQGQGYAQRVRGEPHIDMRRNILNP